MKKNDFQIFINRKSSTEKNTPFDISVVIDIIQKILYEKLIPSAGEIYGLKIRVFVRNNVFTISRYTHLSKKRTLYLQQIDQIFFQNDDVDSQTVLLSILAIENLYREKYGNMGTRYALIECGCFLQTLQLLLLNEGIHCCPLGVIDDSYINTEEEALLHIIIN